MEPKTSFQPTLQELWASNQARLFICGQEVCPTQPLPMVSLKEESEDAGPFNR